MTVKKGMTETKTIALVYGTTGIFAMKINDATKAVVELLDTRKTISKALGQSANVSLKMAKMSAIQSMAEYFVPSQNFTWKNGGLKLQKMRMNLKLQKL